MKRPNILYINSHDTGRLLQPYGHAIPTPNLQRFAEEGVLFRQAFCASPTCSPSRAALLTGSYPHENGMLGLAHRGFGLYDYKQHLVTTLKTAGYMTALAGFEHVATDVSLIGYDRVMKYGLGDEGDAEVTAAAVEFLRGRPAQPFYLEVGLMATHREFPEPTPEEDARYSAPAPGAPDTPETRYDMACFKRSARLLDNYAGEILDALAAGGLAGDTLVIYTTDHGAAFPRMKCNLTDGGTGIALMMRGPGVFSGGKVVDAMVTHLDLFPTVCDVAGIAAPKWLRGKSLVPLASGATDMLNDAVYSEVTYHAAYEPQRAVRTGRWKYIRRFGKRRRMALPNCDDGPTKSLLMEHGWGAMEHPTEALYDVVIDPSETDNLAGRADMAETLSDMRARLDRWMRETDDPMLAGEVAAPAGARVNDPDGLSSTEKPRIM